MGERVFCFSVSFFSFLVLLLHLCGLITAQAPTPPWLTLSGSAPAVVAKGGFSGLFPESSQLAYDFTYSVSSLDTISWCDVQLTKDGVGICLPTMLLDNCTDIQTFHPNEMMNYSVNGVPTSGLFSVDYDFNSLFNVSVIRSTLTRSDKYDASRFPILTVEDVKSRIKSSPIWLNIQHDIFYREHNLSMRSYLLSISKRVMVDYVSSPEVDFLRSILTRLRGSKTKLVFRFLEEEIVEPSTSQTYGSLLKNLTFIKTFASGILVPKNYIWPVTSDNYLQPHTSVVSDAHKVGLEIFASGFANDASFSYNYSYDPLAEYLNFIDNGVFSVDGVLTDFPITASEAIGCFSHINKSSSVLGKPLVITHNGASGIYPDCTDLAYQQAVADGADFIDCPVQITQDGILVCMSSINLIDATTVVTSPLRSQTSVIPEIQGTPGIYTFNFTWDNIRKNLKPAISTPQISYGLVRNPRYKNAGNFMKLSDFLTYAKGKALSGIMISIEHAAFLAGKLGYSVTDDVIKALKDAGFSNQTAQEVMIQSSNSSVLSKFKQQTNYKLVYMVDETISNADASSLADIKKFASYVAVEKKSIFPQSEAFITSQTDLVMNLQSAGFSVFVYVLSNEYPSQPWDFFSDPTVQINSYFQGPEVDGFITDFPGTATQYKRNTCLKLGDKMPNFMIPAQPGGLLLAMAPTSLPPALAPFPILDAADVVESPLPPAKLTPPIANPPASQPSKGSPTCIASFLLSFVIATLAWLLIFLF